MTWLELAELLRQEASKLDGQEFPDSDARRHGVRGGMSTNEVMASWKSMELESGQKLDQSISVFALHRRWLEHSGMELFFLEKRLRIATWIATILATPHYSKFLRVVPEKPDSDDVEAIEWLLIYCWASFGVESERAVLQARLEGMGLN